DGMKKNQAFPEPIITPTTKEKSDREISAEDLVKEGWVDAATYQKMAEISLKLFKRGSEFLAERGIILVDTKYEFGLIDGELVLIDEIHTPDSSRFWSREDYEKHPESAEQLDKEYVRSYLLQHKKDGRYPAELPPEVVAETTRRYREIFRMITASEPPDIEEDVRQRVYKNLLKAGLIKPGFVAFVTDSPLEELCIRKMQKEIEKYGVFTELRVIKAPKNDESILQVVEDYNLSVEPGVAVAVAECSSNLGEAMADNLTIPVINCPPSDDETYRTVNVNLSLAAPTIVDPGNAAQFAVRCLNLPALRERIMNEIKQKKKD
ncbi:phosphoribosylaminoimidazolesuccinocarboxamide synthase, partial [Caldithrix abyssi]